MHGSLTWRSLAPGHVRLHKYTTVSDSKHLPSSSSLEKTNPASFPFQNCGSLPEIKHKTEATSHGYTTKPTVVFCYVSFQMGCVPDSFATTRDHCLSLFNEMTKLQICICKRKVGVVTGLTPLDLKHVKKKKVYQQQLPPKVFGL